LAFWAASTPSFALILSSREVFMTTRGGAARLLVLSSLLATVLLSPPGRTQAAAQSSGRGSSSVEVAQSNAALVVDGSLEDPLWRDVQAQRLVAWEKGAPEALGGDVRVAVRGDFLCIAARLPEPGGKVLARSVGRNPIWERDAIESPPVEDRLRYSLRYRSRGGGERNVTIEINPWGGYRFEENGNEIPEGEVLRAAAVSPEGWTVESAVSLDTLDVDAESSEGLAVRVERIRSRRSQAPEFQWSWPARRESARVEPGWQTQAGIESPGFRPPALGNTDPVLEVGRVLHLPNMEADWDHPDWKGIPEFVLPRNEPFPRKPRYGSQIKWMHDGRTLAILARFEEPEPVEADNGGRDAAIASDDHFGIYLATDGAALLEMLVNPVGAIRDNVIRGPHAMNPASSWESTGGFRGWNAGIETRTNMRHGGWVLRMNIPLDQCARELRTNAVPSQWRILLTRLRSARPGEASERSSLPVVVASSFYGPLRYRAIVLRDAHPAEVSAMELPYEEGPSQGLAGEIARLDPNVWTPLERRYRRVRSMVDRYLENKAREAVWQERQNWQTVKTREDWERFRDVRIAALRDSVGRFPPERPPLDARVTARHQGRGYRLENIVFQSRPNYWMTANLYLPEKASGPMPGIVIVHSQHYPKTQGELHDMGELWSRAGAAVLVMERPGYGERVQTTPWYRQAYGSRFLFTKQLFVAGESYSGWAAWDVIRSVDYLLRRSDIARDQIIVLGSVAGGGEPAGVAAALDPRISAVAPFNYDQGHVRVHGDSPGQIAKQFSPWVVAASVAPRNFIRAFEFSWEGAEKTDYPDLWVDGLERSRKVWGFYDALDNLATSQAYGLIRLSMERVSHCFSIGPQQRVEIYPTLERWFGIPLPSEEDLAILPDSQLSTNPQREAARVQEAQRRRPHSDLLSLPPELSLQLERVPMHRIAREMAAEDLNAARKRRSTIGAEAQVEQLRKELAAKLGEISPNPGPDAVVRERSSLSGAEVQAVTLTVEDGISVPLLLLLPKEQRTEAVAVGVAQGGKERFLANRAEEIARLLQQGVAVCLPDVRATGETSPSPERRDNGAHQGLAQLEFDLGRSLLGSQLRDLRTVLAYLRSRTDLGLKKIALWGDSFVPANPQHLYLDEVEAHSGPQIQYQAEPLGAHLALLAALYEKDVHAVVARGGLDAYLSMLDSPFTYVPIDVVVLGILKTADISDIAAALSPRPLRLERLVTGRNVLAATGDVEKDFASAQDRYRGRNAGESLVLSQTGGDVASWLATQLR
jgi:hypothetical protein